METGFKKRQVERSFQKFRDYTSYVFRSEYLTFPASFDNLINFCETDDVMKVIATQLKQIDISYDDWFINLPKIGIRLREFRPPFDETKRTALFYKICVKIHNNEINVFDFCHEFDIFSDFNQKITFFNTNLLTPLVDSFGYKIDDIIYTINEEYQGTAIIPFTVFNVYYDNKVTIGDNNEFNAEAAIGRGANIEKK